MTLRAKGGWLRETPVAGQSGMQQLAVAGGWLLEARVACHEHEEVGGE